MKLYLRVTEDKYEFPIAIAESQAELARMVGVSTNTIGSALCNLRSGRYKSSVYREVDIDDDTDD